MKSFLFALFFILASIAVIGQQVPREKVIVELGTGTWCQFCPAAANGVDDLVANGHDVGVIEYHSGDSYATSESEARVNYYNITGFPTAEFDGVLEEVGGGGASQSKYNDYLPLYNQRIAIPSSFTVDIYGENTGNVYDIVVDLEKVAAYSGTNLKAHLVVTESHIPENWHGMTEVNFVCRKMVPNDNGTAIDFSSGDNITLNLQFTKDANWDANECELVAFIQDDNSKEILQGSMVELNNLQPYAATAGFSADTTVICEGGTVSFTDESMGALVSWDWVFEGGTPPTSTDQNPVVTYNTDGYYDVQLTVSDGTTTDVMLVEDMISVLETPAQPDQPAIDEVMCQAGTYEVYTNDLLYATTFNWELTPASAGTIVGDGDTVLLELSSSFAGNIDLRVHGENQCGIGPWSDYLNAEVHANPVRFDLSPGGGYCEGENGIELTLDGSETDASYELYLDDVPTGNILNGTGSPISFGFQTEEGIYSAKASNDYCSLDMIGNSYIFLMEVPAIAGIPDGAESVCNHEQGVAYNTSGADGADTYTWFLSPAEAGTIEGTTEDALINWSDTWEGTAMISVQGENDCGVGEVSEEFEVTVNSTPQPEISGDAMVCDNTEEIYSIVKQDGSTCEWMVEGGTLLEGAGTEEITVLWDAPGTGNVSVTETSAADCQAITEMEVTIDECTAIDYNKLSSIKIYPNPAKDVITIDIIANFERQIEVKVYNLLGELLIRKTIAPGTEKINIGIGDLQSGVYAVELTNKDEGSYTKRLMKH